MVRKVRKLHRRLAGPLALLWLVLSNSAWCGLADFSSQPAPHAHHGAAQHATANHEHAPESAIAHGAHSAHGESVTGCCDNGMDLPCCGGSAYAPGFDSPVQAKLLAAAIPPTLVIGNQENLVARVPVNERLIRPPGDPPVFVRCCSWLI
jgi:hypothetical protein